MAFLCSLPLDIVKEVASYLDFDSVALLYWTFDARMQRILVKIAGSSISLNVPWTIPLRPASSYFLKALKDLHQLTLKADSRMVAPKRCSTQILHLSPRHLNWRAGGVLPPDVMNYRCLFQSLVSFKLEVLRHSFFAELVRSFPYLPQHLQLFHVTFSLLEPEESPDLTSLIKALPQNLAHFVIEDSRPHCTLKLPLQLICLNMAKLEILDVRNIDCSSGGDAVNLPNCLTSLNINSSIAFTEANLKDSKLTELVVGRRYKLRKERQRNPYDLENLAPRTLNHLELVVSHVTQTLPPYIISLKAHCNYAPDFAALLERLILPLKLLRTLAITLHFTLPITTNIDVQLPRSLENLHLDLNNNALSLEELRQIFGTRALSTPHFFFEFEALSLTSVVDYALSLPQAKLKVRKTCDATPSEISVILGKLRPQDEDFCPILTLEAISKYLNGAGRLEFRMCLCPNCLANWNRSGFQRAKRLVMPMAYYSGRTLASYGGISFAVIEDAFQGNSKHRRFVTLPPSLEALEFSLPGAYSREDSVSYSVGLVTQYKSLQSLTKLLVLDLGAVPVHPEREFWDIIPRSVTKLRSSYELDPQIRLGGVPKYVRSDGSLKYFPAPLDLQCLDTPYFVYDLEELPHLCSHSTLTTLCATIRAEDSSIFEFARHRTFRGTPQFPNLQTLKLRALPTVTGTLFCNHRARVTLHTLQHELVEAFQSVDVLVIGCLYSDHLAIDPSVTHAILDNIPNSMILARLDSLREGEESQLQELKATVTISPGQLQFPQSITSLDLTLLHRGHTVPPLPPLPLKLRHLKLRPGKMTQHWLESLTVYSGNNRITPIGAEQLPSTLESIAVLDVDSIGTSAALSALLECHPQLPQLSLIEMTYADDAFLNALCDVLPTTVKVKVEVAEFSGCFLPLGLVDFSWKTAFSQGLALEARFPNLEIAAWKASTPMTIVSKQVKTVCLNLDFRFDSLFDAATSKHKERYIPLMQDLITLQAHHPVPIGLPMGVERLELSMSRELFQDAPFREFEKTMSILSTRKLFDAKLDHFSAPPTLTHLTIRRVDLPTHSVLEGSVLPKNLQVLNLCVTGELHEEKEVRLVDWSTSTPKLREVNLGPGLKFTSYNPGNAKFTVISHASLI